MARNNLECFYSTDKCKCRSCDPCDECHYYPCRCCCTGVPGADGKSAYQIALDNGYVGTEQEWLESLKCRPEPFLSSYIEAVGTTQTVNNNENFIFDIDPDILDIVGTDIEIDRSGSVFTIVRAGLYRIEWSMNILTASNPVLVGLLENGEPASALSNNALSGNYSSGALISVSDGDLPYAISLHNFGAPISITNPTLAENTAVSIRISRFADAPNN